MLRFRASWLAKHDMKSFETNLDWTFRYIHASRHLCFRQANVCPWHRTGNGRLYVHETCGKGLDNLASDTLNA